jgi:hypothetical protein
LAFSLRKKTKSILLPIWPQKDQFKRNKKGLNTKSFLRKEKKTLWILVENIYDF